MAKFVFKDGTVKVNGVDLSDHVRSVDTPLSKDQVDDTGLNGNGLRTFIPGLGGERFVITFANDFAASSVYATLYPLYRNEADFEVEVVPNAGAASATNPRWRAFCKLFDYVPVNAAVGALSETQVNFIAQEPIVPYTT
jgi:hypothetical protein